MKILLHVIDAQGTQAWLPLLQAALPEFQVDPWQPGLPGDYDMLVGWRLPQQLIDEQPGLRAIFNLAAGMNQLLALDLPPGLPIARLVDAGMAVQMAEYVCHAAIGYFRDFKTYEQHQKAAQWTPLPLRERSRFAVGVMGLGALGERVASALQTFDFPVLGWSRSGRELPGVRSFAGSDELVDFLAATRVLVSLLPLTAETRGLLNRHTLGQLPRGSYLINVARGTQVVEDDLRKLLDNGQLAGATLDVMQQEPLPPEHWLWRHPRVRLTPHVSAVTGRQQAAAQAAAAVRAVQAGRPMPGTMDPARGY